MSEITVEERVLLDAIQRNVIASLGLHHRTTHEHAKRAADGVIAELVPNTEGRLLRRARGIMECSPKGSDVYDVAEGFVAKCGETAKPDAELDKRLDREWVESKLGMPSGVNRNGHVYWTVRTKWGLSQMIPFELYHLANCAVWEGVIGGCSSPVSSRRQFLALCEGLGVELKTKGGA